MTLGDGFPAASGTVDSTELRKALAGLVARTEGGTPISGVFRRHDNALVTSKASMAVDVGAFEGIAVRGGGPIFMANDGTVSVSIGAAPASNSRIDVVYFKQNESAAPYSDVDNAPVLAAVAGTASASPVKPSIPTGAVELATILVPAGVSATNAGGVVITQTFRFTAVNGGMLYLRNDAELQALPTLPADTRALRLDTGVEYRINPSSRIAVASFDAHCMLSITSKNIANNSTVVLGTTSPDRAYAEVTDPLGWHNPSSDPDRITPTLPGRYRVTFNAAFSTSSSGVRGYSIRVNGAASNDLRALVVGANDAIGSASFIGDVVLNGTTDYVTITVFQDSGGTLQITGRLQVEWLGAL